MAHSQNNIYLLLPQHYLMNQFLERNLRRIHGNLRSLHGLCCRMLIRHHHRGERRCLGTAHGGTCVVVRECTLRCRLRSRNRLPMFSLHDGNHQTSWLLYRLIPWWLYQLHQCYHPPRVGRSCKGHQSLDSQNFGLLWIKLLVLDLLLFYAFTPILQNY